MSDAAKDRAFGALIGLAMGDAVGTTVEFQARDTFAPLTDMVGGGPFKLKPGEWTDDTSMALCLADTLIAHQGRVDARHLLCGFVNWWQHGWNSVTGVCFDIGIATTQALSSFLRDGTLINNAEPQMQANGSIMRLAPVVLCARSEQEAVDLAMAQGQVTHAAPVPQACCEDLARLLWRLVETGDEPAAFPAARRIERNAIISSGHAPATLQAAIWSVATTTNPRDAILTAANLGDDADTVAAVAGQIAGARYSLSALDRAWVQRLAWRDDILQRCEDLWALRSR
ncbi:ADP-ribosylglycohydrolase family protein [Tianweitania populi]|uniref:ADP-ribosylglycohydrolase n=1 Tax=Tianweitania populi TaxID=1607949 RepID=A0A8J3DQ95_9HYPH|nr:ADP-ribosylglycohydrolase family protein [Tianweitania populi]GHD18365.1 ADP-ribosylglycohydrolase [Tianweitania populi]